MGRPKGSKNKESKCWMSKDGISSMVFASNQQKYLDDGWHFGHDTDNQKKLKKRWYNNGVEQHTFSKAAQIPDGWVPGMLPQPEGKYSKFQFKWYTNGVEQKRLSLLKGDVIPEGWWEGQSYEMAEKSRNAPKGHRRTLEQIENHKIGCKKAWVNKINNGTANTSKPEEEMYLQLCEQYGEDNVKRNYNEDERYPWHCDFYIISEDLFIELNKFPTHYTEPFNKNNPEHIKLLEHCKTNPNNWVEQGMVNIWAGTDVLKYETAIKNKLNYQVIY